MTSGECEEEYEEIGKKIGALVDKKQKMYGDSFHKSVDVMKILYPDGVMPDQYQNLLAIIRIIDKLFRAANHDLGDESAFNDIAGYGILMSREETNVVKKDETRQRWKAWEP